MNRLKYIRVFVCLSLGIAGVVTVLGCGAPRSHKGCLPGDGLEKQPIAEAYEPNYTDAFDRRYGLFIHWIGASPTQRSGVKAPDGTPYEPGSINAYANDMNVDAVADEIEALGFEYVLITDFHGFGTMLHPSAASDRWRGEGHASKRDVIGEMIAALKARGIGFVLFTHPLCGHIYADKEALGWSDSTDGYKRWNDFINDIYAELAERYGNEMMGMGFDSEFGLSGNEDFKGKLDLKRLRETILSKAPHLQLYGLAAPNETCEFGHKEVWRADWHDPWRSRKEDDYDVETWPAYRRMVSVVVPDHWVTIRAATNGITHLNAEQMYRYTVIQAATATEGPGSAWAASPYADGAWEKGVREVFAGVATYMNPVRASLTRVYPSTSYPTPEGAMLSTLPHGMVATKATDDRVEYIHVLNPPNGKTLVLPTPADGKRFASATLMHNGHTVEMEQTADALTLVLGDSDVWSPLNTVIVLDVDGGTIPRRNLALHKKVTASDGLYISKLSANSSFGRVRLTDGQRHVAEKPQSWSTANYGWSSKTSETSRTQWVRVDLGSTQEISEVRLYPRDDPGSEGLGFPIDYRIEVSGDGEIWKTVASAAGVENVTRAQVHPFHRVQARYVRLLGATLRQQPDDNLYSMQVVELEVYE